MRALSSGGGHVKLVLETCTMSGLFESAADSFDFELLGLYSRGRGGGSCFGYMVLIGHIRTLGGQPDRPFPCMRPAVSEPREGLCPLYFLSVLNRPLQGYHGQPGRAGAIAVDYLASLRVPLGGVGFSHEQWISFYDVDAVVCVGVHGGYLVSGFARCNQSSHPPLEAGLRVLLLC